MKNKNYKHKTIVQWTQNNHDHYTYNINNWFIKSISNNEIIEKKENFLLIKFSNEEFFNIQH